MYKFIFFLTFFLTALALQWIVGRWFAPWGSAPPLAFFAVLVAIWHLSFPSRLWFALLTGIAIDSLAGFPFGTFSVVSLSSAIMIELLKKVFSNVESGLVAGLSIGFTLLILSMAALPAGFLLGALRGVDFFWGLTEFRNSFFAAVLWAVTLPLLFLGMAQIIRRI